MFSIVLFHFCALGYEQVMIIVVYLYISDVIYTLLKLKLGDLLISFLYLLQNVDFELS